MYDKSWIFQKFRNIEKQIVKKNMFKDEENEGNIIRKYNQLLMSNKYQRIHSIEFRNTENSYFFLFDFTYTETSYILFQILSSSLK